MEYTDILYAVEDTAAVITLNRPDRLNAWTGAMEREIKDAFARADADPAVRGIIVTGAGRGFCAGADMGNLNNIASSGGETRSYELPADVDALEANFRQAFAFPLLVKKPLIAAVNGPAAGIGLVLSLYCDMRFASENARFGTAFSKLGLIAEHGVSWLLPRAVGLGNALDLLYSSRVIGATEAAAMGLVQRVYAADELLPQAKAYVRDVLGPASPAAMAITKRLAWGAMFQDLAQASQDANRAMGERVRDPEFKEGLQAFAEKRPPQWRGLSV